MNIELFNNVLSNDELVSLNSIFTTLDYHPEYDYFEDEPSGYAAELPKDVNYILNEKVISLVQIENYKLNRSYVNLIRNTDVFRFHRDSENPKDKTVLFYCNLEYDKYHYGETIFMTDKLSKVVFPEPGLMVCFDSNILHSPRSFNRLRQDHRFTIALKYKHV